MKNHVFLSQKLIVIIRCKLFLVLVLLSCNIQAQVGGRSVYSFLNLPASARITANGGNLITVSDHDVALAFHNPSLLNYAMNNRASASTSAYYGGINFGNFSYARQVKELAMFHWGVHYDTYGKFTGADETGAVTGEFRANDIALYAGASRAYKEKYNYGVNVKLLSSNYESYNSFGIATDWAAAYNDTAKQFTASLLIKNIGFQFKPFIPGNRDPLPFEVQIGFSKRLKHVPFRISVVAQNLQRFNLRYEGEGAQQSQTLFGDSTDNEEKKAAVFFDNVARHFNISGELYLGRLFTVAFGYNHLRRKELAVETRKGLAGFSFGAGINIKMFSFWYARGRYHIAGASNHVTVGIDINKFMKKNKVVKESKPLEMPPLPVEN